MKHRTKVFAALFACVLSARLGAQETKAVTVDWIFSDAGEEPTRMPRTAWTSANDVLLLDPLAPKSQRTLERVSAATGARRPAVNRAAALASLKALLGPDAPDALRWPDALDRAGKTALYAFADDVFALDLAGSRFTRLTSTPEPESVLRISPDGRRASYVRGNDLYVCDIGAGSERRLTRDGSATVLNGTLSWVYWEEVFSRREGGTWWSEDSSAVAFLRTDESPVSVSTFVDFKPATPRLITQRYPKAGEPNPTVRVGIADVASGSVVFMDPADAPYEYVMGLKWMPDSRRVAVHLTNRAQTRLDLCTLERGTGKLARILTETDPAFLYQKELQFLEQGKRFLISSERTGNTHLYRYADDGTLVNAVTKGDWSVRGPGGFFNAPLGSTFVDEARGFVYFTALEKSSIEHHLYRIRLDGSGMERLTKESGTHAISFSPDRSFYLDVHSSHATLPSLSIHASDGALRTVVTPARNEVIAALQIQVPELLTIPAADGFALPARLTKPRDFDPSKKYPIVMFVYGGPGAPTVQDAWSGSPNVWFDQVLVNRGYVVASVDNRSATAISKKLEDAEVGRFCSDKELADLEAAARWLKAQPWADPSRLGIWGWSGGGTATLLALTRSKEWTAGISVAANTDSRFYDTIFSEMYMKTPQENPDGYEHISLVRTAKDLHGRLLLVHGSYDDNVHPQHTWAVVDELVKAGKQFDLMIYPMRKHGIDDRPARRHLFNKMLEFWKLYL